MSRIDLAGRGVLLSGATGGIGREIAYELSRRGAKVALLGRPSDGLDELADELERFGAVAAETDLTDRDAVVDATDEAADRVGGLVAAVAGAGIVLPSLLSEQSEDEVRRIVDVNLFGTLWTIQAALPHVDRVGGHLVAIASIAGLLPAPLAGLYPATKAAIAEIVAQLRLELTHRPTSAGVVYFGKVDTDMSTGASENPRLARALARTPTLLAGSVRPERAARTVVDGIERRRGAVVQPAWQLPAALPQLAIQRLLELGIRFTPLSAELPTEAAVAQERRQPA